jgi:hypothetical protein
VTKRIRGNIFQVPALLALGLFLCAKAQAFQQQDYYQAGSNVYVCASTGNVTLAAGLTAATTGLILVNPPGSNVKLVMLDDGVDITASPAAAAGLELAYNLVSSTGLAPNGLLANVTTAFIGLSTGTLNNAKALCYTSVTLPATPVGFRMLGGTTGATAIGGVTLVDHTYPPGSVILVPGTIVSLQATSLVNVLAHYTWIEVPL